MAENRPAPDAVWHGIDSASFCVSAAIAQQATVESDAFGAGMGRHLYLPRAPMVGVQDPRNIRLAVTRLASDRPLIDRTLPFRRDPFFTVQVYLQPTTGARLWHGPRPIDVNPNRTIGSVTTHDFDNEPSTFLGSSFDILQFYIPREALNEFSDQNGLQRSEGIFWETGDIDETFLRLALGILPALENPAHNPRIYLDYLILAAHSYIAQRYTRVVVPAAVRGGLAPWQRKRAAELLRENLDGRVALNAIADECGLSPSHFAHAFKASFGVPPHRWLIAQRIAMAKDLLLRSALPIVDVALCSGFSDQSAFFRAFKKDSGTSPDRWRRQRKL